MTENQQTSIPGQNVATKGSAIDRLRASGQMTPEDEAHHVRLMGAALDRANPKAKELFKDAAADAVKHYEQAKR